MIEARTTTFASNDLGRTEQFLSSSYAPMRIERAAGGTGTRIRRVAAGTSSVDLLDLDLEMTYDVQPLGKVCLCDITSGTIREHRVNGGEAEAFGTGEIFSLSPPDRPYSGRICQAGYSITMFDPALLAQTAGSDRPVELLDHRPVDGPAARHLRAAIEHLRRDVLAVPEINENALVVSAASRNLAAAVLNAFPHRTFPGESAPHRRDSHPGALRRAVAFIEANAQRDIGAAEIAGAAHVSIRAVQLAFRLHLDLTPMAYVRRVRLDHARAELKAASPDDTTVTRVAARWGYGRPSAFAAHYRAAYGELPSHTLRSC
ncbi:helix-turn-helix domain-containing protein [Amycolatopsis coloradensis]|uniref:Helix-turn-helix domain-containing protein n=1 Tax=Amycolatopsis coloradensis TaxID=76021 RepID=A0ACD5BP64_9PSEU